MEVMNINDLCRCVFTRKGSVCTFVNCMGNTFAVGPDGSIYPCYRFVAVLEWVMGNVHRPTMEQLLESETRPTHERLLRICRYGLQGLFAHQILPWGLSLQCNCSFFGGALEGVDPHCAAYKRIFDELNERLNKEMFENPVMEMTQFPSRSRKSARPGMMALMRTIVEK